MADYEVRHFAYAHTHATMTSIKEVARKLGTTIGGGYDFIEKSGETKAFDEMIELAKQCKRAVLYVETVKEFKGDGLDDFKASLTALEQAGVIVKSFSEQDYNYAAYMTVIEVLESTMSGYLKDRKKIAAYAMYIVGAEVGRICELLGMKASEVHEAIAEQLRLEEEAAEKETAEG